MLNKNIAIVVSNIFRAVSHEWIIESLQNRGYRLYFILLNPGESMLESFLLKNNVTHFRINYRGKKDLPRAVYKIVMFLLTNKVDIVHTHLFDASLAGLTAAWLTGVKKRVCSRHHSTHHHDYFPSAVKYDRFTNYLATDIIAASRVVQQVLTEDEGVAAEKVHLVYHGFRLDLFQHVSDDDIAGMKDKYKVSGKPVIGVIARWTKWKGIQYTIEAFRRLLRDYPDALLVLANANGDYESQLLNQLKGLPGHSYRIIRFETQFEVLYRLFDIFVHVPVNERCEAFGQVYVESLASGIPSVFTLSGVASEVVKHERNALVVPFRDADAIDAAVRRLLSELELSKQLTAAGRLDVAQSFQLEEMIDKFEQVYQA